MIEPAYLAGFFDGEGTVKITYQKSKNPNSDKLYPHAHISIAQSGSDGLELLEKLRDQYGGNIYNHLSVGQYKATKPAYKLYWNKEEGARMLAQIIPYLRLKKQAAEEVFTYLIRNEVEVEEDHNCQQIQD